MNLTEELQKLAALRRSGALTDEEFSAAKRQLLRGSSTPIASPAREDNLLGRAVSLYVIFKIVFAVIGFILFLYFFSHTFSHFTQIEPPAFR